MAINILEGATIMIALQTIDLVDIGLEPDQINRIYTTIDGTFALWRPTPGANNQFDSIEVGKCYMVNVPDDIDLSEFFGPPLPDSAWSNIVDADYNMGTAGRATLLDDEGVSFSVWTIGEGSQFAKINTTVFIPAGQDGRVVVDMLDQGSASLILDTNPAGNTPPINEATPLEMNMQPGIGRLSGKNYSAAHGGGSYPYNFYNNTDQTAGAAKSFSILVEGSTVKFQYTLNNADLETATWVTLTAGNDGVTNTAPRPSGNLYVRFYASPGSEGFATARIMNPRGKGLQRP